MTVFTIDPVHLSSDLKLDCPNSAREAVLVFTHSRPLRMSPVNCDNPPNIPPH